MSKQYLLMTLRRKAQKKFIEDTNKWDALKLPEQDNEKPNMESSVPGSGTSDVIESQDLREAEQQFLAQDDETSSLAGIQDYKVPDQEIVNLENKSNILESQDTVEVGTEKLEAQSNPLSLINGIGIVGSGALGALYASLQKEKTALESSISNMEIALAENKSAAAKLKEDYENRLFIEQQEQKKQARKFKEEEASITNQLESANIRITSLYEELRNEKKLAGEFKADISHLESKIAEAKEDKEVLEGHLKEKMAEIDLFQSQVEQLHSDISGKDEKIKQLSKSLSTRDNEYKELSAKFDHAKECLESARSKIDQLSLEISRATSDLDAKIDLIKLLNEEIQSLTTAKGEYERMYDDLASVHADLKSSSEASAQRNSELIIQKDAQLRQLEEKIAFIEDESSRYSAEIAELKNELSLTKSMFQSELENIENLKKVLLSTEDKLRTSENEASNLLKESDESRKLYEDLVSKYTALQDRSSKTKEALTEKLKEAEFVSKRLSDEVASVKETLRIEREELQETSNRLASVVQDHNELKKELLETYKKLESTTMELNEEKNVVLTFNKELETIKSQALKDSEARRALETDLEEATKSLDEMNKSAMLLSAELERVHTSTATLEAENEMLGKALSDQKRMTKEVTENMEDAQNLISRLGTDRGAFESRSKKLEEELSLAKGEILRLRRQISSSSTSKEQTASDRHHSATNGVSAGTPFAAKKATSRRRKSGPSL